MEDALQAIDELDPDATLVQAIGVLLFMFVVSWQLSLLAFVSVPVITILSKWYGNFVRSLTKLMQKKVRL